MSIMLQDIGYKLVRICDGKYPSETWDFEASGGYAEPYKDDFGGRTTVNERGEFECDDGLDGFTATVEDSHKRGAGRKEPNDAEGDE